MGCFTRLRANGLTGNEKRPGSIIRLMRSSSARRRKLFKWFTFCGESLKLPKYRKTRNAVSKSYSSVHIHYNISFPAQLFIQIITSNPTIVIRRLSARITTSRGVLVVVVDGVLAVTGHARRRHSLLLHGLDGGVGGVVLGADLVVEGSVGGGLVEGGDFGEVLAVGLAGVLDSLVDVVLVMVD
jgi:hypothetical protein